MTWQQVTKTAFDQCVGQTFALTSPDGQQTEIRLAAVEALGRWDRQPPANTTRRESFSLQFSAPVTWRAPQRIYTVTHPELGSLDMFLVPLGPDAHGMRLEAIFNFTS